MTLSVREDKYCSVRENRSEAVRSHRTQAHEEWMHVYISKQQFSIAALPMLRPTYISAKGHLVGRVARRLVLNGGGRVVRPSLLADGLVITYRADLSLV